MKKIVLLFALFLLANTLYAAQPRYVFYFIGDGMGINAAYATQLDNQISGRSESLNFLNFPIAGIVTTYSASSKTTDSAAAGTALACGVKTKNKSLGLDADGAMLTSIAELAGKAGYATGLATTVGVNHATPAAFYAHVSERNLYETITEQFIASRIDFLAGGGFIKQSGASSRDYSWHEEVVENAGIKILRGKASIADAASVKSRLVCISGGRYSSLPYAVDRSPEDLTLADLTAAGIEYLSARSEKGFFFMIEGGRIDQANHSNDAFAAISEINDFASSIDVALNFMAAHPDETLIVVTSDHETGALANLNVPMDGHVLARFSESELNREFRHSFMTSAEGGKYSPSNGVTWDEIKSFFAEKLCFWDEVKLSKDEESKLRKLYDKMFNRKETRQIVDLYSSSLEIVSVAVDIFNRYIGIKYQTSGHSAAPVGLFVKGCGENEFMACRDNTDIPRTISKLAAYGL